MAALGQIHAHDGIAQIQQGEVDGQVGLCTGMGLDVGVLGTEQLAGALDGDVLHLIHIDAAAVVTLAGQASAYLLVSTLPMAAMTAGETMFSLAMSSMFWR